jgi:hypothetical protein
MNQAKLPKAIKTIKPIEGFDEFGERVSIGNVDQYRGVYSIGLDLDPKKQEESTEMSKIGVSGLGTQQRGLLSRIRSYYIAFPDGVWIYALLISTNSDRKFLLKVEKEVHKELEKYRYRSPYLTNLRNAEWFKTNISTIRQAFLTVKQRYPDDLYVLYPSKI